MKDKNILITGATDGIGKRTSIKLAGMGANVIVHGRSRSRAEAVLDEIKSETGMDASCVIADLSSMKKISKLAEELKANYEKIDVLINNAGVFQREQAFSEDGFEMTFAVNHLAHFALSLQLLPLLRKSKQGRIITLSSIAHQNSPKSDFTDIQDLNAYIDYSAYSLSKLANVLFSKELAIKLEGAKITSNSLHPGVITTKLLYEGFGISGSSVDQGCLTSVYLASEESLSATSGKYFSDSRETEPSAYSFDPGIRRNLWDLSEKLTGIRFNDFK